VASAVEPTMREGEVLAGRYRIGALIGEGGYGKVYQATQLPLGREVAIKVVLDGDPELVARFAREASIAQSLEHPNTVRVLDMGTTPSGLPFLALELLRGHSVHQLLEEHGHLGIDVALEVTSQVLKSLAEAHAKGIVHRDIKPENIFVTSHFGEPVFVKVLDFGIAKKMAGSDKLTVNGEAVGTPNYMPPEQIKGLPIDGRTDLYAVGLLLAEMVTGNTVFDGGPRTLIGAQLGPAPAPLEDALKGSTVGPLVERAVRKNPLERFQTAGEMLSAIQGVMTTLRLPASAIPSIPARPIALTQAIGINALPSAPPPSLPSSGLPPTFQHLVAPTHPMPQALPRETPRRTGVPTLVLGAIIGTLTMVVVVLIVHEFLSGQNRHHASDETTEEPDDRSPTKKTSLLDVSPRLDPRAQSLRTTSVSEVRHALVGAGYQLMGDDNGGASHNWAVKKAPCMGSILLFDEPDEEQARSIANTMLKSSGMRVLVNHQTLVSVGLTNYLRGGGLDAACTRDAAKIFEN